MKNYKYYNGLTGINTWHLAYCKQVNWDQERGKMESK
jgi:hypothetical protein